MNVLNGAAGNKRQRSKRFYVLASGAALLIILVVAIAFIPTLDGLGSRRAANEAVAVGTIRRLTDLEARYFDQQPTKGFTCQFAELETVAMKPRSREPDRIFATGEHVGYKFILSDCEPSADGRITKYHISAEPLLPGKTGIRAFCADQSSVIWYDAKGSVQACLSTQSSIL